MTLVSKLQSTKDVYYDYWNYRGYEYSQCHYNEKIKNVYINIPKNASTNVRHAMLDKEFCGINLLNSAFFPEHESATVVLRDPIERWISGITTYLDLYVAKNDVGAFLYEIKNNKWFFELLFEKVTFDDHTEKQTYFLKPFDLSNCFYFYLDDMFEFRFTQFYLGEGIKLNFNHEFKNISSSNPVHSFFTEFLLDSRNLKYKEKLKAHFAEDYELINSVTFYGK